MGSIGVAVLAVGAGAVPRHRRWDALPPLRADQRDEWTIPKLWPGSWASTTQPVEALYQLCGAGRVGACPAAAPAHPQLLAAAEVPEVLVEGPLDHRPQGAGHAARVAARGGRVLDGPNISRRGPASRTRSRGSTFVSTSGWWRRDSARSRPCSLVRFEPRAGVHDDEGPARGGLGGGVDQGGGAPRRRVRARPRCAETTSASPRSLPQTRPACCRPLGSWRRASAASPHRWPGAANAAFRCARRNRACS